MSCERCREEWMAAFDSGLPEPKGVTRHLETCLACQEVVQAGEVARRALAAYPKYRPDPAMDRALLAALAEDRRPEPRNPLLEWLAGIAGCAGWKAIRPLAAAGAASFVLTLATAGSFWIGLDEPAGGGPPAPAATRRAAADVESELDAWLSQPAPRARLPLVSPAPVREQPVRQEPEKRTGRDPFVPLA